MLAAMVRNEDRLRVTPRLPALILKNTVAVLVLVSSTATTCCDSALASVAVLADGLAKRHDLLKFEILPVLASAFQATATTSEGAMKLQCSAEDWSANCAKGLCDVLSQRRSNPHRLQSLRLAYLISEATGANWMLTYGGNVNEPRLFQLIVSLAKVETRMRIEEPVLSADSAAIIPVCLGLVEHAVIFLTRDSDGGNHDQSALGVDETSRTVVKGALAWSGKILEHIRNDLHEIAHATLEFLHDVETQRIKEDAGLSLPCVRFLAMWMATDAPDDLEDNAVRMIPFMLRLGTGTTCNTDDNGAAAGVLLVILMTMALLLGTGTTCNTDDNGAAAGAGPSGSGGADCSGDAIEFLLPWLLNATSTVDGLDRFVDGHGPARIATYFNQEIRRFLSSKQSLHQLPNSVATALGVLLNAFAADPASALTKGDGGILLLTNALALTDRIGQVEASARKYSSVPASNTVDVSLVFLTALCVAAHTMRATSMLDSGLQKQFATALGASIDACEEFLQHESVMELVALAHAVVWSMLQSQPTLATALCESEWPGHAKVLTASDTVHRSAQYECHEHLHKSVKKILKHIGR